MSDPYIVISIPGAPEGKRAHNTRVAFKNGKPFVIHYPDENNIRYEKMIADYARLAMRGVPTLRECAVSIAIEAFFPVPVSWSKTQQKAALAGRVAPLGKPDWDNIAKSACDALKGIVWDDDSRVVMGQVAKTFSDDPGLRISIWKWFEEEPEEPAQGVLIGDFV